MSMRSVIVNALIVIIIVIIIIIVISIIVIAIIVNVVDMIVKEIKLEIVDHENGFFFIHNLDVIFVILLCFFSVYSHFIFIAKYFITITK